MFSIAFLAAAISMPAEPKSALAGEQAEPASDYNGEDFTRPLSKFQTRLENKTSGTASKTDTLILYLQTQGVLDLDSGWDVSWFAELPVASKSAPSHDVGLGDIELQAALFRPIDERWALGFGARFVVPTAKDMLGHGKWQIMPLAGVRYSFLEFGSNTYFVPKVRYAVSIGGDSSRRSISELQFAPTLNIGLPNHWFVALYPSFDIRMNFGDPVSGQTGRLFLPIDAAIGRKLGDNIVLTLEGSVPVIKDYPVYDYMVELRVSARF